jgi:hypothetical protein
VQILPSAALSVTVFPILPFVFQSNVFVDASFLHKGYVNNLNRVVAGTEYADLPLEKIITGTAGRADGVSIVNNAAIGTQKQKKEPRHEP